MPFTLLQHNMKFVADEGVDAPIVKLLRELNHEVYSIQENNSGINDDGVLRIANERNEILITQDKDFGELVYRLRQLHSGIILIKLTGLKPTGKANLLALAIEQHHSKLFGSFTVINKNHVKIRSGVIF